jgi:putative transposase
MDPGIRTFQTVYSEESVLQIKVKKELIKKLQRKIDQFRSLRDRKLISRSRLRRRERKVYRRLNDLIDDLHHKTCSLLTNTYDHIILPSFESQEMAKGRKIRGINRDLLQLKHFLFKERLKSKCDIMSCTIDICTEEYTSQTCGACGELTKVKGSDIFHCSYCALIVDRDVNGARNIAIKRLKEML